MIDVVYAHYFGEFVMTFAARTQIGSLIRLHYLLSISVTFEIIYFKKVIRIIVPFNTVQITKICEINSIYTETLPHSNGYSVCCWLVCVHVHHHTEHQSKNGERFLLIILVYVCVLAMVCVWLKFCMQTVFYAFAYYLIHFLNRKIPAFFVRRIQKGRDYNVMESHMQSE